MPLILEQMLPQGAIEEMKPVPEAYVPIIKLVISGTDIDLNFTRLAISSVPLALDCRDTNLLRGLDERELRALNGPRVADELLELVPQKKTFRTALRAIKLWAQSKIIVSVSLFEMLILCYRACRIWQHCRLPRWCGMGNAGCESLPTLSTGYRLPHYREVFSHHRRMELASAYNT